MIEPSLEQHHANDDVARPIRGIVLMVPFVHCQELNTLGDVAVFAKPTMTLPFDETAVALPLVDPLKATMGWKPFACVQTNGSWKTVT